MPSLTQFETLWKALRLPVTPVTPRPVTATTSSPLIPATPMAVYEILRARYTEPHRKFHNFTHIEFCLRLLDASKSLAREYDFVAAAIWFHDAIYDTHAQDNEEQSANLADALLPLPDAPKKTIHDLIMDTKHQTPPLTPDGKLLADIDLAGIGGTSAEFAEGCAQIREEYGWVPAAKYKDSRGKFLRNLLNQPVIYHTASFHQKYEKPARANLQEELDRLDKLR